MNDFKNHNEERRRRWEEKRDRWERRWERKMERHQGNGHVWAGLFLLAVGGIALAKSMGVAMPDWLFSWQMLLIAFGLFVGARKGFRDGGWFVPIIIGGAFLANDYFLHGELRKHIWPLVLIGIGIVFVFHPRRQRRWRQEYFEKKNAAMKTETAETITPTDEGNFSQDDFIETTSIFGGTEKVILSKNFKGGNMVNVFGGSEINLTQADMTGTAVLDVTCIFGGATLIVPANWVVKSEAVTIFGGISDKRSVSFSDNVVKNLVIKGTVIFGGMEIKSY